METVSSSTMQLLLHRDWAETVDFKVDALKDRPAILSKMHLSAAPLRDLSRCWITVFFPFNRMKRLFRATSGRDGVGHWHQRSLVSRQTLKCRGVWFKKKRCRAGKHLYDAFYLLIYFIVSSRSKAAIALQCILWMEIWTLSMEDF